MPTYNIRNKKTGKIITQFMTISEMEQYEKDHPNQEVMCGLPLIHDGRGLKKPDSGFRDVLKRIKKASGRGANINTF